MTTTEHPWPWRRNLTDDERNVMAALADEPEDDDLEPAPFLAGDISDTDIEYDSWKDDRLDPDRNR